MIENSIQVSLDRFDGPLALLLHLVQKDEIDIKNLNINRLTQQYIDYLNKFQNINFDTAAEYLYIAASLLFIKSKSVAHDEEEKLKVINDNNLEITTKAQLIEKLEELQKFQKLGQKLWLLPKRGEDIFVRPKVDKKSIQNTILVPMSLDSLTEAMLDFIRKEKRKYTVVKRDKLSIKEKLVELKKRLQLGTQTTLKALINDKESIDETVITFISILELARLQKLDIFQNEQTSEIYVNVINELESFDVETADGFDPEDDSNDESLENKSLAVESTNHI